MHILMATGNVQVSEKMAYVVGTITYFVRLTHGILAAPGFKPHTKLGW
jgi:hypothetical protein